MPLSVPSQRSLMTSRVNRRLELYIRRLEELRAWRNAQEHPIREWLFTGSDVACTLKRGEGGRVGDLPVRFSSSTTIPREWAGQPVELELWLGGEGFVCLSTGVEGGLDPFDRTFRVTDARR